jgi:3-oxoacyl-[acyl-carrier protein] reductase
MSDTAAPAGGSPNAEPGHVPPATVVVVSGASRGLGLAMVTDLLEQGVQVAAFARTVTPELEALADRFPQGSLFASVDITDEQAGQAFFRAVEEKLGVVDGLVNNAAIGQDSLHVHTPSERIHQIIDTNLTAPLVLTRFWLRRLLGKGRRGRLVNVTSICGQRGYPGLVAYSATKGGLDAATRSLAREFSGRVLANAVAPGFFDSEMSAVLGPAQLDTILRRTPSGRLTAPEDVVPVVRMLLLEDTNINGQSLGIDGAGSI